MLQVFPQLKESLRRQSKKTGSVHNKKQAAEGTEAKFKEIQWNFLEFSGQKTVRKQLQKHPDLLKEQQDFKQTVDVLGGPKLQHRVWLYGYRKAAYCSKESFQSQKSILLVTKLDFC